MRIGCGTKVHRIRGRDYLYFWHYEPKDGERRQVLEYVGPARDAATRAEAVRRMAAYYDRAVAETERRKLLLRKTMAGR